jgi:hypothetical protein
MAHRDEGACTGDSAGAVQQHVQPARVARRKQQL